MSNALGNFSTLFPYNVGSYGVRPELPFLAAASSSNMGAFFAMLNAPAPMIDFNMVQLFGRPVSYLGIPPVLNGGPVTVGQFASEALFGPNMNARNLGIGYNGAALGTQFAGYGGGFGGAGFGGQGFGGGMGGFGGGMGGGGFNSGYGGGYGFGYPSMGNFGSGGFGRGLFG